MPWCTFNFVFIVISRRTAIHVGLLFLLLGNLYLKALSMDTHLFLTVQGGEGKNTTGFGSGTEGVGRVGGRVSSTTRQWGTWEPHTHTHCGFTLWPHRLPLCSSNREGRRCHPAAADPWVNTPPPIWSSSVLVIDDWVSVLIPQVVPTPVGLVSWLDTE